MDDDMADTMDLGPCCACGRSAPGVTVRTLISLAKKAPIPGHGWGCVVCDLPTDGAMAVVCDKCFDAPGFGVALLQFACRGFPGSEGRVPIAELTGEHRHDMTKHPGEGD